MDEFTRSFEVLEEGTCKERQPDGSDAEAVLVVAVISTDGPEIRTYHRILAMPQCGHVECIPEAAKFHFNLN